MRIRLPIMIQDPKLMRYEGVDRLMEYPYFEEPFFLDGPVARQVAVLDFDPTTGALEPGVPLVPPKSGNKLWRYDPGNRDDVYAREVIALSVFGTVLRTMRMFEEEDALGRELVWGFDAPQLLIVPRAGQWANAFYERATHSLQFFFFPNPDDLADTIYTALSRDIVAHETGHAILDGIAPHLYDALTPQGLAIHEAVADLTAALMALRCERLKSAILARTGGSIRDAGAFGSIAEEYGMAAYNLGYLRNLMNDHCLPDVNPSDYYALCNVLSGALYAVMVKMHEAWWDQYSEGEERAYSASGKALAVAADQFKRMILRALDYLPPAEVSFADYGRAILAADQASHPDDEREREWICDEFVQRGMVPDREVLEVHTDYAEPAVAGLDLETLVRSDWAAYDFGRENRSLLHIPPDVPFHVEPRLDVTKLYYVAPGRKQRVRECLFKVWWIETEPGGLGTGWPARRAIPVGTTLAIDWQTRRVRALLTTDRRNRPAEGEADRAGRDALLRMLVDAGVLRAGDLALGPDGRSLRSYLQAETADGVLRVRGTARLLHITGEGRR
ncbi:MAG: hypothetical protein JXA93_09025 [Anaerolineae bacterium]|nr:hypothetical protein [Anaerolineae bacterium]